MSNNIIFLNTDPRHIGGIESFARSLNLFLSSRIVFISLKNRKIKKETYPLDNVINVNRNFIELLFQKTPFISNLRCKRVNKVISKLKPSAIIINSPNDFNYIKNTAAKIILVQHTTAKLWKSRKIYFNNDNFLIQNIRENTDKIVCLSPEDIKDVSELFFFPKEKLTSIRHSTEISILEKKKVNNKRLVMISRLNNNIKRFDLAIEGMALLPDFELHIYGSGKDGDYIKKVASKRNNVFIHNAVSDVKTVLDENSIYVSTSEFEGYPISSIEATRRGLPIVMRNTHSSASDIIDKNGILLEAEWSSEKFVEAVKTINNNYDNFSEAAINRAPLYDFETFKKEWSKLLS